MSTLHGDYSHIVQGFNTMRMTCDQQIFSRAPIYELIFALLSPGSLVQVARTCRAAHQAVVAFKQRAFNINRHLSRYFSNPLAFRSLQAKTGTLISGSNALQFLDRSFYPDSDLDLYTHPGHTFEVCKWLVEVEGYYFVPRENQDQDWREEIKEDWDGTEKRILRVGPGPPPFGAEYPLTGIEGVYTFKKLTGIGSNHSDSPTVQVVDCSCSPFEVIVNFHSSCVMNFIAFNAAYSLYPLATFEERSSFAMYKSRNHVTTENALAKYTRRGWRVYFVPRPRDRPHCAPFMFGTTRGVGDKYTWTLPLDTIGVIPRPATNASSEPFSWDPVLFNGWTLTSKAGIAEKKCEYFSLQATVFRYNYCIPDEETVMRLRKWATDQGYMSHRHLSRNNWSWFDADIPGFLSSIN